MEQPARPSLLYIAFLITMGLMLGGLFSFYQPVRYENARRYTTREIILAQRINRKLQDVENKNSNLESEISVLNYRMASRFRHLYHNSYLAYYNKISDLSGIQSLEDDGLEIILKDSGKPLQIGEDPNTGIVHNVDLLNVVNQLWASGAKAISLNDQRLVAGSEISCAGPVIIVNKTRVSSPFIIHAVGNIPKMAHQMEKEGSYLKYLSAFGIETSLEEKQVFVPAYTAAWTRSS